VNVPAPRGPSLPVANEPDLGVIAAKLVPHRRPRGSVSRPHLLKLLRDGHDRALTLVSAPAGYGKTTMLTEWVATEGSRTPFAWVTLDGGDADPVRLWSHIVAALAGSARGIGDCSIAALRAHSDEIEAAVLPALFEELDTTQGPMVLILDDFHLAESPTVDEQVATFLRYRPDWLQVVVATRADPALGVATLRASDDLVEVRADNLRFAVDEVAAFFRGVGLTELTDSEVERLAERTEGWPAPIRLAALLLPERDHTAFIDSFTGERRQVVDYLTGDVLDLLAPDTREFLLQVSILRRLSGPLCDAVVGGTSSGARLAELEQANFFLTTDGETHWYYPHQLFTEALRLELARTSPDLVPVLHSRASAWLAQAGDFETATHHAIAARDVDAAAQLVARQVQVMAASGRSSTTQRWLDALSWPEALEEPELAFVRAVAATLDNRYDDALDLLRVARAGSPGRVDAEGLTLGFRVDFLQGVVAVSHVGEAASASRRAVESAPSSLWEGVALACLGQALYLQGRFEEAVAALRRAVSQISDGRPILLAFAVGNLALAEVAAGDASPRTGAMARASLAQLGAIGAERTLIAAVLHLALGEQARRDGDLRGSLLCFETPAGLFGTAPRGTWHALAHLFSAAAYRELGETTAALDAITHAEEILDRIADPGQVRERATHARHLTTAPHRVMTEFGDQLSERELDVLRLAAAGLVQRQIAEQLFISYNTVKSHFKTSYRKLGVSTRAEALARLRDLDDAATLTRVNVAERGPTSALEGA
jgi:LuxR family maltose regulon positive regulatory protein